MVENMSGFACSHCNETDIFGNGDGERTAKDFGVPFLGRIPLDPQVVVCGDSGTCYQVTHKNTGVTDAFDAIAERMSEHV